MKGKEENEEKGKSKYRISSYTILAGLGIYIICYWCAYCFFMNKEIVYFDGEFQRLACWSRFSPYSWMILTPENKTVPNYLGPCSWLSFEFAEEGAVASFDYISSFHAIYRIDNLEYRYVDKEMFNFTCRYSITFNIVSLETLAPHLILYNSRDKLFLKEKIQLEINAVVRELINNQTFSVFTFGTERKLEQIDWTFLVQKFGINIVKIFPGFCVSDPY